MAPIDERQTDSPTIIHKLGSLAQFLRRRCPCASHLGLRELGVGFTCWVPNVRASSAEQSLVQAHLEMLLYSRHIFGCCFFLGGGWLRFGAKDGSGSVRVDANGKGDIL